MKVTASCSGRFHIFDQASQLQRHGALRLLINGYPKWITRRWSIPNRKVKLLLFNGIIGRLATMLPAWIRLRFRAGYCVPYTTVFRAGWHTMFRRTPTFLLASHRLFAAASG